jgi:predicted transcriptional regulator
MTEQNEQTIEFQRMLSTALCLIRNGLNDQWEVAAELDIPPIAMLDLLEELKRQEFIIQYEHLVYITRAGRRAVQHITLVKRASQHTTFERWSALDPDGRQAA